MPALTLSTWHLRCGTILSIGGTTVLFGLLAMMGTVGTLTQGLVQVPGMKGVSKSVSAVTTGNGRFGSLAVFALHGAMEATAPLAEPAKGARQLRVPLAEARRLLR